MPDDELTAMLTAEGAAWRAWPLHHDDDIAGWIEDVCCGRQVFSYLERDDIGIECIDDTAHCNIVAGCPGLVPNPYFSAEI